jgi:hypothetical protein
MDYVPQPPAIDLLAAGGTRVKVRGLWQVRGGHRNPVGAFAQIG